jgi:nucleoside-diphosphate-sugar epimerase
MKALFIGGTGLISTAVSRLAVERGMDLTLLNRGKRGERNPPGARQIVADINDTAAAKAALGKLTFDVVVNWIAFTPDQVERDIGLFAGRAGQYIFISSASAYQKPPSHYLITESTPLSNPFWLYSRNKIACEERLMREHREKGFPFTTVRPSHTYSETRIPNAVDCGSAPWTVTDRMRKGKKIIVPGDGTSLWVLTHNTDFAKGFVGLMGNPRTLGHAFHITSDEPLPWDQITRINAAAAGGEAKIVHIPSDFIATFKPEETGSLIGDKARSAVFDTSKIKAFVPGFACTVPYAEGARRSVAWFDSHPEAQAVDGEFNALMDTIIAAYETGLKLAPKP